MIEEMMRESPEDLNRIVELSDEMATIFPGGFNPVASQILP
jgi:hypothetical protein